MLPSAEISSPAAPVSQDDRTLRRIAHQILDHATYCCAAVVEEVGRLVRRFGEAV